MKKYVLSDAEEGYQYTKRKKNDKSYFDKLFMKIFLSSLIVLVSVISNNLYQNKNIKLDLLSKFNSSINVIKILDSLNDSVFKFIEKDTTQVYSKDIYDEVEYKNNINYVRNDSMNYVKNLVSGYVTKIIVDDLGYTVTVKGIDNLEYIYSGVKSIDVKLYQYVDDSTIIGLAVYNDRNKKYEFMLIIKEEHRCYSFYDKAN